MTSQVRIDPELRELYVVSTVYGGPADLAGIHANDAIMSIDGVNDLASLPVEDIGLLLSGKVGTKVDVEIRNRVDGTVHKAALTRAVRNLYLVGAEHCFCIYHFIFRAAFQVTNVSATLKQGRCCCA